jgi:hypothetical protein
MGYMRLLQSGHKDWQPEEPTKSENKVPFLYQQILLQKYSRN